MSNSINTNIAAYYAQANITQANQLATSSVARLSSGNAIVQASDNVAALAIGNSLNSQVQALQTAGTNASQGTSLLQVADGALAQIGNILNQQNSIALQAASGSLTNTDRGFLNEQFQALTNEINALATGTTFNGVNLLDGSIAPGGSASALENSSINALTSLESSTTNAGFQNTTSGPAYGTVNFTGFTDLSGGANHYGVNTNGLTQYTGFTASGHIAVGTVIAGPSGGGNDTHLFGTLAASGGTTLTVTANAGGNGGYVVTYTIGGHVYTGTLASATADGKVAANATVTLTGSGGAADGTITFSADATGYTTAGDNHAAIQTDLIANLASAVGYNGYFLQTPTINQPTGSNDQSLFGALSGGIFSVTASGTIGGTSTGYTVNYTLNGITYQGTLANDGVAGHAEVAAGTALTLTATTNPSQHATIALTTGARIFGSSQTVDQSSNIQAALTNNFAAATGFSAGFVAPTTTNNGLVVVGPTGTTTNDSALYGDLSNGTVSVAINGTGIGGTATGYTVSYTINGVTYQGTLGNAGAGNGIVSANTALTLTATSNPTLHSTIHLVTGSHAFGISSTVDQSLNIKAALQAFLTGASVLTTGTSSTVSGTTAQTGITFVGAQSLPGQTDTSFTGSLTNGFTVTGSAGGPYTVTFTTAGGTAYSGTFSASQVTNGGTLALTNTANTGQLVFTVTNTASTATAANFQTELNAFVNGATAYTSQNNQDATITGQVAQTGIGSAYTQNDIGKNDTALVGNLSKGVFTVTGSTANGYSVSYALNGSTYQGSLTAAEITGGSTLVLDNGKGTIAFGITASTTASPNANTATASALQTALTAQFSGATAYAKHQVLTANATDTNGVAIAGSAIAAVSSGVLTGFSGANVTLQSALFSGVNLPSISTFSATGSGTSTVLSVIVNGVTYSTAGTVTNTGSTLQTATFNGQAPGVATFYANGNTTSKEQLTLNFTGVTGAANINTTADVTNLVDALNTSFGSGGSNGGLQFQLGTTTTSNVTVTVGSARTTALYAGQALDISTQVGASAAATQIGTAINTVTSLRAGVGALESQFNFAAAAIQTSTQNQQAAAGQFLDTNIATESTKFATEQVKLQAGISVLAQANQQLQALLKLIG